MAKQSHSYSMGYTTPSNTEAYTGLQGHDIGRDCYNSKPYIHPGPLPAGLSNQRYEGNYPPPLISRRLVPLPALAACPITLNPLLAYTANMPPITLDLSVSASAATLSPSTGNYALTDPTLWRQQPATRPANVGSMTIRLAGAEAYSLWRPIVVFPESVYDSVVTIDDVLKAVSCAFRVAILGRQVYTDRYGAGDNQRRWNTLMPSYLSENGVGSDVVWWSGLYSSPDERDVWILHTRMYSHV